MRRGRNRPVLLVQLGFQLSTMSALYPSTSLLRYYTWAPFYLHFLTFSRIIENSTSQLAATKIVGRRTLSAYPFVMHGLKICFVSRSTVIKKVSTTENCFDIWNRHCLMRLLVRHECYKLFLLRPYGYKADCIDPPIRVCGGNFRRTGLNKF